MLSVPMIRVSIKVHCTAIIIVKEYDESPGMSQLTERYTITPCCVLAKKMDSRLFPNGRNIGREAGRQSGPDAFRLLEWA